MPDRIHRNIQMRAAFVQSDILMVFRVRQTEIFCYMRLLLKFSMIFNNSSVLSFLSKTPDE